MIEITVCHLELLFQVYIDFHLTCWNAAVRIPALPAAASAQSGECVYLLMYLVLVFSASMQNHLGYCSTISEEKDQRICRGYFKLTLTKLG